MTSKLLCSIVLVVCCLHLSNLVVSSNPYDHNVSLNPKVNVETDSETMGILYTDVPMSNLVRRCFQSIPLTYREKCLFESYERFIGSVYPLKSRCCTKWSQIECIEKYAYNAIYCDMHQRLAVSRFFNQIKSLNDNGSPECSIYRPIDEERQLWSSDLGRVPKCAVSSKEHLGKRV
ncbi:hypothetical protein BLOT_007456 [Blomia tropicalis]|nr:hypothetical protein BLOT_007456 [Blomia tropicalis]